MNELTSIEVEEVSGAIITKLVQTAYKISTSLYSGGMHFYYAGQGDHYLHAVWGGNLGA